MDESTEEWRPVVGYEGLYEISNRGRVRSLDRVVAHPSGALHLKGRTIKAAPTNEGYLTVALSRDGKPKTVAAHVLVARAFLGPRPPKHEVCHWDGNPKNNAVANLRWGTRPENSADTLRHGRFVNSNKTHCKRGHCLGEPNLVAAKMRRGVRECLSCSRAHDFVRVHPERDRQQVADEIYLAIGGNLD